MKLIHCECPNKQASFKNGWSLSLLICNVRYVNSSNTDQQQKSTAAAQMSYEKHTVGSEVPRL